VNYLHIHLFCEFVSCSFILVHVNCYLNLSSLHVGQKMVGVLKRTVSFYQMDPSFKYVIS